MNRIDCFFGAAEEPPRKDKLRVVCIVCRVNTALERFAPGNTEYVVQSAVLGLLVLRWLLPRLSEVRDCGRYVSMCPARRECDI